MIIILRSIALGNGKNSVDFSAFIRPANRTQITNLCDGNICDGGSSVYRVDGQMVKNVVNRLLEFTHLDYQKQ